MFVQNTSEYPCTPEDLLTLPIADLVEKEVDCFAVMMRADQLPQQEVLAALDEVLLKRVMRILHRRNDTGAWAAEIDDFRRLVPHERRDAVDRGEKAWASRWDALCDLLAVAAEQHAAKQSHPVIRLAHGLQVLKALVRNRRCSQVELGKLSGLRPANLSRIVGLLEANELIRREAVGREKFVELTESGRAQVCAPVKSGNSKVRRNPQEFVRMGNNANAIGDITPKYPPTQSTGLVTGRISTL